MCGLAGVILAPMERDKAQWDVLRDVFTRLLLANEVRGRHATGVAVVRTDGEHRLYKAPVCAREIIEHPKYWSVVCGVDGRTTALLGHTRWPTVGDLAPLNNQPIRAGHIIGTHNGTIRNHHDLTETHAIGRFGEVDSEVLFRLALKCWRRRGWRQRLGESLQDVEGTVAAFMVSKRQPDEVLLLRMGKPLALAWVEEMGALIYTSDIRHLRDELDGLHYRRLKMNDNTLMRVSVGGLPKVHRMSVNRNENLMSSGHKALEPMQTEVNP